MIAAAAVIKACKGDSQANKLAQKRKVRQASEGLVCKITRPYSMKNLHVCHMLGVAAHICSAPEDVACQVLGQRSWLLAAN